MKRLLILFFFLAFTPLLLAQEIDSLVDDSDDYSYEESNETSTESLDYPSVDPRQVWQKNGYDSERVEIKRFDAKKWKEVVGETNYTEKDLESEEEKAKEMEDSKTSDSRRNLSLNLPIPPLVLKIIFFGLVFGAIVYLLFTIFKNTSLKAKLKEQKKESEDPIQEVVDIKELEVDSLLQKALAAGNYPLAIRICFLGLLKKLDEDGFIIWKKNKTNRDYLTELFRKDRYFEEVKRLTLAYEEVWYGDHDFSTPAYEKIISSFKAIDQKLNASKTGEEGQ